jgi:hypothetical protein
MATLYKSSYAFLQTLEHIGVYIKPESRVSGGWLLDVQILSWPSHRSDAYVVFLVKNPAGFGMEGVDCLIAWDDWFKVVQTDAFGRVREPLSRLWDQHKKVSKHMCSLVDKSPEVYNLGIIAHCETTFKLVYTRMLSQQVKKALDANC